MDNKELIKPEMLSPLVLAYLGDAVYELNIRKHLISLGYTRMNQIHKEAVHYVNAKTQARVLRSLEDTLSPQEADIVRRGRNAKSGSAPKNTDIIEYRYSTALECLIGYLFLKKEKTRLDEIFSLIIENVMMDKGEG